MSYFPKSKTYEIRGNEENQDFLISHYKSKLLEKTRSLGNFADLQYKFRELQSNVNKLSNEHLKLKYELSQFNDDSRKRANDLRKQNEYLLNQIKDKETVNRQLFNDNKILNYEIDKHVNENCKLKDEVLNQKTHLSSLQYDKSDLDNVSDEFLDQTIKDIGQGKFTSVDIDSPEA